MATIFMQCMQDWEVFALTGLMVLLHFAQVARVFVLSYRGRRKTRVTPVNSKKCPVLNSEGYVRLLCMREVEVIPLGIVFAMKIFARVVRVTRLSDLACHRRARPSNIKNIILD